MRIVGGEAAKFLSGVLGPDELLLPLTRCRVMRIRGNGKIGTKGVQLFKNNMGVHDPIFCLLLSPHPEVGQHAEEEQD